MPTPFFSKFPLMYYDFEGTGKNLHLVRDILHRADFKKAVLSNTVVLYPYTVKDGETPEIIASKLYGDSQYYWIIMFANEIYNIWTEWPLSYDQFVEYVIKKYGSIPAAQSTIDHYENADGVVIDFESYAAGISYGTVAIDAYTAEDTINTDKKYIKVLDPKYLFVVEQELDKLMLSSTTK